MPSIAGNPGARGSPKFCAAGLSVMASPDVHARVCFIKIVPAFGSINIRVPIAPKAAATLSWGKRNNSLSSKVLENFQLF